MIVQHHIAYSKREQLMAELEQYLTAADKTQMFGEQWPTIKTTAEELLMEASEVLKENPQNQKARMDGNFALSILRTGTDIMNPRGRRKEFAENNRFRELYEGIFTSVRVKK